MQKKFRVLIACTCFFSVLHAQNDLYNLTSVPLGDLSFFKNAAANWQVVGNLKASYNDTAFTAQPGTGILLDAFSKQIQYKEGVNIFSAMEHGDMYLQLDFMMPKGSNSGIYLQSRYEVQLLDSWGVQYPKAGDCGGIYERWDDAKPEGKKGYEGHAPLTNACLAPGLWQHLEILFRAPRFNAEGKKTENARFLKVMLNGVVIHENISVTGPTRAAAFEDEKALAPLMIQGDHGMVAFRNIQYAALEDLQVPLSNMQYEYYEGHPDKMENFTAKQLVRKGNAREIDVRLADAKDQFYLKFTGNIDVPVTENYHFAMRLSGTGKLEVDGREVIPATWSFAGGDILKGDIQLTKGKHNFVLHCYKNFDWFAPGLALYVSKANSKLTPLHTPSSLPALQPTPLIELQPGNEPELLRSFLNYKGKKLTHCISVGDPAGVHYSYNLKQGGLLQVWKGGFLNTTDMWYERGEPQTAAPEGAAIILPGRLPLALDKNNLPDTLPPSLLQYKGYVLDAQRYPSFNYSYSGTAVTDRFTPVENGKGLKRTIQLQSPLESGVYRLAEGTEITNLGNGLYAINNQSYYVQLADKNTQASIIQNGDKKELTVNSTTPSIQYIFYW